MQIDKDRYFFYLLIFTLIFGVTFYAVIRFDYMDELCALALFVLFGSYMFKTKGWEINKAFLVTLLVFLFYLGYSFYIHSNSASGILNDLFSEIKPYLGFFCVYSLAPKLDDKKKEIIKALCVVIWLFLLVVGIGELAMPLFTNLVFGHPATFACVVVSVCICYLFCSKFTLLERLQFLAMLSIGLASGRSKFFGFMAFTVIVMVALARIKTFRLNVRNALIMLVMLGAVILVAWPKIDFYFYQGIVGGDVDKDMMARLVLYANMPTVLMDHIPFGSGLASYATFASGSHYSPLYAKYGIDNVWGMTRDYYSFIADTYYPSLAQFGFVGIGLFITFWVYLLARARAFWMMNREGNKYHLYIIILIIGFFAIESIAATTFISYTGVFLMMMAGLVLSEMKDRSVGIWETDKGNK
jgi:hypothetical protein